MVTADVLDELRRYEDAVYLHQVVERTPAGLQRYADVVDARTAGRWREGACEWRVHFHVPVFLEALEPFASTQSFVRDVLAHQRQQAFATQLEVETYTWSVLPPQHRTATRRGCDRARAGVGAGLPRMKWRDGIRARSRLQPADGLDQRARRRRAGRRRGERSARAVAHARPVALLRGRHVPQRRLRSRVRRAPSPRAADSLGSRLHRRGVRCRLRHAGGGHRRARLVGLRSRRWHGLAATGRGARARCGHPVLRLAPQAESVQPDRYGVCADCWCMWLRLTP